MEEAMTQSHEEHEKHVACEPRACLHTYILHTREVCRQDEEEPICRASFVALRLRHFLSLIRKKERKKERKKDILTSALGQLDP
jgi:hypothetical protein